jgi:hypothetical protein
MNTHRIAQLSWGYLQLTVARIVFWLGILFVVVVGLRLMNLGPPPRALGYAELIHQIDNGNVARTEFRNTKDGVILTGELRGPGESFRTLVPNDQIEALAARLGNPGLANHMTAEMTRPSLAFWGILAVAMFGLLAYLVIARFWVKQSKRRLRELSNKESQ